MSELEIEKEIIEVCQKLYAKNMLAACDGNISVRDGDRIWITPSGQPKAFLKPGEMACMDLSGKVLKAKPSSEAQMHLKVYQTSSKARAVIHAHPPTAIAWSIAKPQLTEIPSDCISEVILATGRIPIVPYARPSTPKMGEVLIPYVSESRVMVLARHGALSWGESLQEAYLGMERLEHSCQILKAAVELGGLTSLPKEEVAALFEMRSQMDGKTL
jgi:L-fuculose-phosphate aldolase